MTTLRQEVAAMLMDYAQQMPDQTYQDILGELSKIPDSRDPHDTKVYLDRIQELEECKDILEDTLTDREAEVDRLQYMTETGWGESTIPPPDGQLIEAIPDEVLKLAETTTITEAMFWPFNPDNKISESFEKLTSNLTNLWKQYEELWNTSQILQFNNDYLRLHRNDECKQLELDLDNEKSFQHQIHYQYLKLLSETMGDVTISCNDGIELSEEWMGTFTLLPNSSNNCCSVYQSKTNPDIYLYNANGSARGTVGDTIQDREWVVLNIKTKIVGCRIQDTYSSYIPPASDKWCHQNNDGHWVISGNIKLNYHKPYVPYRLTNMDLPTTQIPDDVIRGRLNRCCQDDIWEREDNLCIDQLMSGI
jgi:hypothetical protein